MSKSMFVNEFMATLDGNFDKKEMEEIVMKLSVFIDDWEVEKHSKCTDLAPYMALPTSFKAFMVTKKLEGRSDGTLNLYKMRLTDMLWTIGKSVEKITTNDLRIYLCQLQKERNISDCTLDNCMLILNSYFGWCEKEGYILKNPCAAIGRIKFEEKQRQPFTDVQMEMIRYGCNTIREKAIIEVLYSTGCRCSELAGLKKSDVNLESREVHLFGKGKKHRTAFINAKAEVALRLYYESRIDNNDAVFVSSKRPFNGLSKSAIEIIVRKIGKRAGVDHVFPHRFRHTLATDALSHGMPVTDLQALLGHTKIDTTMIYGKIDKSSIQSSYKKSIA